MNHKETYEKNRATLNNYRWRRHDKLPQFEELAAKAEAVGENLFTYSGRSGEPIRVERTNINTKPFFRDLSKPLLVKNEFNSYNIEYVVDNVRASEDFGADNHVYMYYDNREDFMLLLQTIDITPYLEKDKLVFIFGEEDLSKSYPIDFKAEYGIDYEAEPPKPVRVEEIKRIVAHLHNSAFSGNVFWVGVLDFHKNLLTIKNFGLVGMNYLYDKFLCGKTVDEAYQSLLDNENTFVKKEFDVLFNPYSLLTKCPAPTVESFFENLEKLFSEKYIPNKIEWYKGMFLAYAISLGRNLNARISPTIAFQSHRIGASLPLAKQFALFDEFKYFRCASILRRNITYLGSAGDFEFMRRNSDFNKFICGMEIIKGRLSLNWQKNINYKAYIMPIYSKPDNKYLPYTRIIRFEDLKLEPKATLEAVMDFFDLEWDDSLMHTLQPMEYLKVW